MLNPIFGCEVREDSRLGAHRRYILRLLAKPGFKFDMLVFASAKGFHSCSIQALDHHPTAPRAKLVPINPAQ